MSDETPEINSAEVEAEEILKDVERLDRRVSTSARAKGISVGPAERK